MKASLQRRTISVQLLARSFATDKKMFTTLYNRVKKFFNRSQKVQIYDVLVDGQSIYRKALLFRNMYINTLQTYLSIFFLCVLVLLHFLGIHEWQTYIYVYVTGCLSTVWTGELIWFSFTVNILIGTGGVNNYFGVGYLHPSNISRPWKKSLPHFYFFRCNWTWF